MNVENQVLLPKALFPSQASGIDHIAIAVTDLETAVSFYTERFGFEVKERRVTQGSQSGMISAVVQAGNLTFVLLQGTSPKSPISRYIETYGPGVQHIAITVEDINAVVQELKCKGVQFDTDVIRGEGLLQTFMTRDPVSGLMLEFIQRAETGANFQENNVQSLFEQLESRNAF